ncbi:K02A2.6-like [Cordylochernes scorpioides]|uniref:RNA-directed DNA polymerase n=1 Tax=Cordylochernes scorpioides TaxID=51811 RepID=A0ABY6K9L0_9ARAC|nr:K02A2.6-like [Cordylochernes scorpioides]
MENIKPPAEFVPYNGEKKWETWREAFEIFSIAADLESMPLVRQRAILKHILGEKTVSIYKTFRVTENEAYPSIKEMLDIVQKEGQGITEFVTELKQLAQECEFEELAESLIRDRFIIGMIDQEVKKKLLEDPQLTLPKAISVATIAESVCVQIASWEEKQAMIEKINKNTWEKNRSRVEKAKAGPSIANTKNECKWCGQQHTYGNCPAYRKTCNACGKLNHFAAVCRTRRIRNLIAENEGDESFEGGINVNKVLVKTVRSDKWSAVISINGNKTSVHLDTGAQINVLPQKVISLWPAKPIIKPTSLKAYAYGHSELPIVGKCEVLCQYGEKKSLCEFIIADVDAQTLITGDTCEKLEILKRINQINSHEMILHDQTKKILEQFHEVFQGVGVINSECKMYTKPEYPPVRALPRRIPASLGNEVQSELEKMVKQGIITKIYHETEWSHPMVVVKKKSGQIRICLDPRKLNQALTDHQPLLPLIQKPLTDISPRLQRIVMKLFVFDFKLQYRPGKCLILADTLSRDTHPIDELPTPFLEDRRMVKLISANISDEKLITLQKDTREDTTLLKIIHYVIEGWPISKKDVDEDVKPYYDFRHRIYLWNELLCVGSAIVVPGTQRNYMLELLHKSHQGISAIQGLARESLFWPGMSMDIAERVKSCDICQKYQKSKTRETLRSFPIPDYPWQSLMDIFYIERKPHLLIVDRFSGYPEVYALNPPTATNVRNKLRETFARFGIPETIMSDNGPPFHSEIMTDFCTKWGIRQIFSSPHLHRSNGLAERNIQTIKTLLNKCKDQGSDAYLALLTYRNTPKNDLPSPAQLCLSRNLRCLIPRITPLYGPCKTNQRHIENAKKRRQNSMKRYYDRSSKIYPKVSVGEEAWCQLSSKQAWTPVKITAHGNSPQSFKVETPSGREFLRNQQFLRPKNGPSGKGESPSLGTSFSGESSPVAADSSSWQRTTEEEPVAGPSTTPIQRQPSDGMAVPSENSSISKPEAGNEYFADALTNMQPHCEDRVSRLKDAMRGLAAPRTEEVTIAPINISCATNIFIHRLEQADETHREILALPRQPTSTMSHGNHRKKATPLQSVGSLTPIRDVDLGHPWRPGPLSSSVVYLFLLELPSRPASVSCCPSAGIPSRTHYHDCTQHIPHRKAVHGIETSKRKVKDEVDTQTPANKTPQISIIDHFSSVSIDRSTDAVLARMIALDGLLFSVFVTSKDLRKCLNALGHEIPLSAETIKIKVCRYADTFREKVVRELQMEKEKGQLFSLTLDEWTSIRSKRYLNINIHSRTKVWNLGLTRISGVFSSEQCKYVICAKLLEFGIDFETDIVCVTTDECAMMVKLGHIIGTLQQLCYAHGLHLAVMDVLYDKKKERVVPEFVSASVNEAESDLSEDNNEDTSPFNVSLKVAHPSFPEAMYPQSLVFSKKNINEVTKKARGVVTCGHVIGTI